MPPSLGSMRIRRCALYTSSVSWIICCCAIVFGAQSTTSEMRGSIMWLGMIVFDVTLLTELSTTKRGDRPSAMTTPSFPTAVRWYSSCSSGTPPGTCAMNPAVNSSSMSSATIEGWSEALFQESWHTTKGYDTRMGRPRRWWIQLFVDPQKRVFVSLPQSLPLGTHRFVC